MIRCPACGLREEDVEPGEDGFEVLWTSRVLYSGPARSGPSGGITWPESWDEIAATRHTRVQLSCPCGHGWMTSRVLEP